MMRGGWAEGGEAGKRVVGYGQESGRPCWALQAQGTVSAMGGSPAELSSGDCWAQLPQHSVLSLP